MFETVGDPVQPGLVARLDQPGAKYWNYYMSDFPRRASLQSILRRSAEALAAAHRQGLDLRALIARTDRDFDSIWGQAGW